jgi:hypothetical protein
MNDNKWLLRTRSLGRKSIVPMATALRRIMQ